MRNAQETYSDEQAFTGATPVISTDIIDHGVEGLGLTEGLWLEVSAQTLFAGGTGTLTIILESDSSSGFGSAVTEISKAFSTVTPAAGTLLLQQHMPVISNQFTRVRLTFTGTASAGSFSAYLTDNPQKEQPLG